MPAYLEIIVISNMKRASLAICILSSILLLTSCKQKISFLRIDLYLIKDNRKIFLNNDGTIKECICTGKSFYSDCFEGKVSREDLIAVDELLNRLIESGKLRSTFTSEPAIKLIFELTDGTYKSVKLPESFQNESLSALFALIEEVNVRTEKEAVSQSKNTDKLIAVPIPDCLEQDYPYHLNPIEHKGYQSEELKRYETVIGPQSEERKPIQIDRENSGSYKPIE